MAYTTVEELTEVNGSVPQSHHTNIHSRSQSISLSDPSAHLRSHGNGPPANFRPSRASSVISTRTKTSISTVSDELGNTIDVQALGGAVYRIRSDGRFMCIGYPANGSSSRVGALVSNIEEPVRHSIDISDAVSRINWSTYGWGPGVRRSLSVAVGNEHSSSRSSSHPAPFASNLSRNASLESLPARGRRHGNPRRQVFGRDRDGQKLQAGNTETAEANSSHNAADLSPSLVAIYDDAMHDALNGQDISPSVTVPGSFADNYQFHPSNRDSASLSRWVPKSSQSLVAPGIELSAEPDEFRASSTPDMVSNSRTATTNPAPTGRTGRPIGASVPMDNENEVSFHYSGIIRSLDASHRKDMEAKEQELEDARSLLQVLARQAVDTKAELIRTRAQVAALSNPNHYSRIGHEAAAEAQSFSFPPLKLRHVRVLRTALKRRAEKLKRGMEDELWLMRRSARKTEEEGQEEQEEPACREASSQPDAASEQLAERADAADPCAADDATSPGSDPLEFDDAALLKSLLSARRTIRTLETERRILEAQLANFRDSMSVWKAYCQRGGQGENSGSPAPHQRARDDIAAAKRQVEETWLARWLDRHEQLSQRMRRIDEDAQQSIQQALADRDQWMVKCANLSILLKQKDEELAALKRGGSSSRPGF